MRPGKATTRRSLLRIVTVAAGLSMIALPAASSSAGEPSGLGVPTAGRPRPPVTPVEGERRYAVSVVSFRAIDESGPDWSGSDEVSGQFYSTRGYGIITSEYGDVDTGDLVYFGDLERCVAPQRILSGSPFWGVLSAPYGDRWQCDPAGVPAPIGLYLSLWDTFPSVDLLGKVEVTYDADDLARLTKPGDSLNVGFILGGPCGHQEPGHVCGQGPLTATGPEYELRVVIQRMNDAPLDSTE